MTFGTAVQGQLRPSLSAMQKSRHHATVAHRLLIGRKLSLLREFDQTTKIF
jgi:hypothetical protein